MVKTTVKVSRDGFEVARRLEMADKLKEGEVVDLNTATVEEVARIPWIGPKSAATLVASRPGGGFRDWGDLRKLVSGWGKETIGWVQPYAVLGPVSTEATSPEPTAETRGEPEVPDEPQEAPQVQQEAKPKQRRRTRKA